MPAAIPGFANAANTGVKPGTTLTKYTGPMTITRAGTVIENKIIDGTLRILADNVTIKNCQVNIREGFWGVDAEGAANFRIEYCDVIGPGYSGNTDSGIVGSGVFLNNDVRFFENGLRLLGGASTVRGNYIHDLQDGGPDPHYDGIGIQGGQNNVLIEFNTIFSRDTSDIIIKNDFGPISNVTIRNNYLGGNPGYNVYSYGTVSGNGSVTGINIYNNFIEAGLYGPVAITQSQTSYWGNYVFSSGTNDVYTVDSAADRVVETSRGFDTVQASISVNLSNTTKFVGGIESVVLLGAAHLAANGNALGNVLTGNVGNNSLNGLGGHDWLRGGAGNDLLAGGQGNDVLAGGPGYDTFRFNVGPSASNVDRIVDFNVAQDTIQLDNAAMPNLGAAGRLNANLFWKSAAGTAHDANDRVVYDTDSGSLYYDANGSAAGGVYLIAKLAPNLALSAADFVVI